MQTFWSMANIPLLYLFCGGLSLFLFYFLFMWNSTLCRVLCSSWHSLAYGEHWVDSSDTVHLALLCSVPVGMSLLARFPQPLWAVPLYRKNSVSELFSHLSPTYSLSSFFFQCMLSCSLCQHCHRRQNHLALFTAFYCFLFLLCSGLNSSSTHTIERSVLIFL